MNGQHYYGNRATRLLLAIVACRGHVPPTVRELRAVCGYSSTASVQRALERLRDAGLVEWEPGQPRTLRACVEIVNDSTRVLSPTRAARETVGSETALTRGFGPHLGVGAACENDTTQQKSPGAAATAPGMVNPTGEPTP